MLGLILAAIQAILQVIVIAAFGVILTKAGYFDSSKQKWLSKLNMTFFTPCLLFSNIASIISFEKLKVFWPIPVFFTLFSVISWLSSLVMVRFFGVHRSYSRFVVACSMFCNANSLPIAVISSLAVSEAGSILYWHADDTQQDVAARGVAYTLFWAMLGNIFRWSLGYHLLQPDDQIDDEEQQHLQSKRQLSSSDFCDNSNTSGTGYSVNTEDSLGSTAQRNPSYSATGTDINDYDSLPVQQDAPALPGNVGCSNTPPTLHCFPSLPNESSPLLSCSSSSPILSTASSATLYVAKLYPSLGCSKGLDERFRSISRQIHSYMSPPLYAALLALIVGLSPLQHLLFDKHSFLYPSVTKAIQNCGKVAVPLILVCLGSQLTLIVEEEPLLFSNSFDRSSPSTSRRAVVASLVTRMMVAPLFVIGTILVCLHYTKIELMQDPMFVVAIIVLGSTPTAINLSQITQVNGVFEEEMMRVLFWSYGVICVPVMTAVVFIALNIVDKTT